MPRKPKVPSEVKPSKKKSEPVQSKEEPRWGKVYTDEQGNIDWDKLKEEIRALSSSV